MSIALKNTHARWLLVAAIPLAMLGACATANDGDGTDGGASFEASTSDAQKSDASAPSDSGDVSDGGDAANFVDAAEAGIAIGSLAYLCPVQFSVGCVAADSCDSTCLGQFQGGPSCTWYAANGVPNSVSCTPVTSITSIATCPVQLSTDCQSAVVCESTCVGQLQPAATCSVSSTGGVASNVACTSNIGQGEVALYQCPTVASTGCENTSLCESTCIGQITTSENCTWRGSGGTGTSVACTALPSQTF